MKARARAETPEGVDVIVNPGAFDRVPEASVRTAVLHTLADADVGEGEVSVTMLADDAIRALNREYLFEDRPTDVIAFSLGDESRLMGDVYVGLEQAARQAAAVGIGLEEELVRLSIHGTLHVLGHDHPEGAERTDSPMYRLQERLVRDVMGGD